VIFGFNTDVRREGTVYHVQSEARTNESLLETQVFVGGRCLGKRATSYAGAQQRPGFSEDQIHDLLKNQHKRFVAAVREGRIETELAEPPEGNTGAIARTGESADAAAVLAAAESEPILAAINEPGLAATPAWSLQPLSVLIGKGLSFECGPPEFAAGNSLVLHVQVNDDAGPVAGAEVNCRITSSAGPASYVYAMSGEDGVADVPVGLDGLDLPTAAVLIQTSFRGKSASRKFQLRRE
jgi:hypothetical protein